MASEGGFPAAAAAAAFQEGLAAATGPPWPAATTAEQHPMTPGAAGQPTPASSPGGKRSASSSPEARSPSRTTPNLRELTQHLVALGEKVAELERQNKVLEQEVLTLKHAKKDGKGSGSERSELRSYKKFYPEKWTPGKEESFKSWADDFLRWVKAEDVGLAEKLKLASHQPSEVPMPAGAESIDIRFVFNHLRKLMGDKESRNIVRAD